MYTSSTRRRRTKAHKRDAPRTNVATRERGVRRLVGTGSGVARPVYTGRCCANQLRRYANAKVRSCRKLMVFYSPERAAYVTVRAAREIAAQRYRWCMRASANAAAFKTMIIFHTPDEN